MKLSARGRTVLAQVERTTERSDPTEGSVRTELALLSDGVVGIKHTWLKPDGKVDFSDGWKQRGRLKPELRNRPDGYRTEWLERKLLQGYTQTR